MNGSREDLEYVICDCCGESQHQEILKRKDGLSVVRCQRCGLAFLNPRPRAEFVLDFYTKRYHEDGAVDGIGYDVYSHYTDRALKTATHQGYEVMNRLSRYVDLENSSLLDIGCALGHFLQVAKNMGMREIVGIDISQQAVVYARRRFGLDVRRTTLENAAFADGSFNIITAFDVVEHLTSPRSFFLELSRVVTNPGFLVLTTPNLRRAADIGAAWIGFTQSFEHLFFFELNSLERFLKSIDFEVLETWTFGSGRPSRVPAILRNLIDSVLSVVAQTMPVFYPHLIRLVSRIRGNVPRNDFDGHTLCVIASHGSETRNLL